MGDFQILILLSTFNCRLSTRNSFRIRTYRRTPCFSRFWPHEPARNSFRFRTYRHPFCNSFRIRTYKKTGGGPHYVNCAREEHAHPERAQRVEGPLFPSDEDNCPERACLPQAGPASRTLPAASRACLLQAGIRLRSAGASCNDERFSSRPLRTHPAPRKNGKGAGTWPGAHPLRGSQPRTVSTGEVAWAISL